MVKPPLTSAEFQRETTDRLRRLETRLTRYMEAQGFATEVRRPVFMDGVLDVPTDATSLRDCLRAIPSAWEGDVRVFHQGSMLTRISRQ